MRADVSNSFNDVMYRAAQEKCDAMIDAACVESVWHNDEDMTATGVHSDQNTQQNDVYTDIPSNKCRMLLYATACPQDIAIPRVLGLLN